MGPNILQAGIRKNRKQKNTRININKEQAGGKEKELETQKTMQNWGHKGDDKRIKPKENKGHKKGHKQDPKRKNGKQ